MFIKINRVSFHLWCKENLLKHQKASKYYESGCTFSGVYTHFDSFLPEVYKVDMIYNLAYRCFKICSAWTKFYEELKFLKHVFLKNG